MKEPIRRALLSVSNKSGLTAFATNLHECGIELVATGGTKRALEGAELPVREVSELTGYPEMMDGRVKTLHPVVHAGILARRSVPAHVADLERHGIGPIDLVVVNLYPFQETVSDPNVGMEEAIENIDIGGPSMLRSAAKNHADVAVVCDPNDYEAVVAAIRSDGGGIEAGLRLRLAQKAFAHTAAYDSAISAWLQDCIVADAQGFPDVLLLRADKVGDLRYGENPHQRAAVYGTPAGGPSVLTAKFLGGKELSFNNYLDLDAALRLCLEFDRPFACVLKHNNPCGAACAESSAQAIASAWEGDPLSAFGSVLGFNTAVDVACADFLVSGGRFVEAILAPSIRPEALERIRSGPKWGKNVRVLESPSLADRGPDGPGLEWRSILGGVLVQEPDRMEAGPRTLSYASKRRPTEEELSALLFAERVTKHVRSNAIVIAKGEKVLGVGAGQMSRVDAVQLAVEKAGANAAGAVMASDAFFPFPDGVELALQSGVTAVIQPGGSIRDAEVTAAVDARDGAMVHTGRRHFRH